MPKIRENQLSADPILADLEVPVFALMEHSILSLANSDGIILFANDRFCETSMFIREELLGKNHNILNSGHHSKEFFQQMWQTISAGNTWCGELKNRRKDGSFFWLEATIVPFMDDNNEVYQYVALYTDITLRKEQEAAFGFLAAFPAKSPVAILSLGRDGHMQYMNNSALAHIMDKVFKGGKVYDIFPPDYEEIVKDCFINGGQYKCESTTGNSIWLWTFAYIEEYECVHCFADDITAQKSTEVALKENQIRFQLSQEFAGIATWDWDIATNRTVWTKGVAPMFGYIEGTINPSFEEYLTAVYPDDRRTVNYALEKSLYRGEGFDQEHRIVWPDRSIHWIHIVGDIVRDEQGKPQRMVGIVEEISKQKEAENRIKEKEDLVRHSQKMQAIGTLAGGIAHDFNNILTVIISYGEITKFDAEAGSELWQNQEEILLASERARKLINQILMFSRKDFRKRENIQPAAVVEEVLSMLRATIPANIKIKHQINCNGKIFMDPVQFHQVLMNVCVNASHAIENDQGEIQVNLVHKQVDAPMTTFHGTLGTGAYILLSVSDNGKGIEASDLERIFEPFFTTKEVGKGTGMGLAAIYGIVDEAKGGITVESVLGYGTIFNIFIPEILGSDSK